MNRRLLLVCQVFSSCTFGGSGEDPTREIAVARADAGLDASEPMTGTAVDPPVVTPDRPVAVDAAVVSTDARLPVTPDELDASTPANDAGSMSERCEPSVPVIGCDPVDNTGCAPLTQCDVEPSAASPTGRCVFYQAPPADGCSASAVSSTCAAQSTCVDNSCRKLCYCNDDCGAGACCTDSAAPGPAGFFKLCSPC